MLVSHPWTGCCITGVFNIMGEEVLEAVVDESDRLASICGSCRCKTVSQGLPMVELELFQCSLPPGSVSCNSGQCGVPTIAARCISHRSTLHQPSQHAASAITARCISHRSAFEFPSQCAFAWHICHLLCLWSWLLRLFCLTGGSLQNASDPLLTICSLG